MSHVRGRARTALFCAAILVFVSPARAQEVQWRPDYAAARREAREKNRPLVLDFGTQSCFWCKKLDQITFRDPSVARLLNERFIPVKVDGEKDARLAQALGIEEYPALVVAGPDGKILKIQSGFVEAADFGRLLEQVLGSVGSGQPAPRVVRGAMPATDGPGAMARLTAPLQDSRVQAEEKARRAEELLTLAQEDYRARQYEGCLERCRALADSYPGSPEGTEAARLIAEIQGNRQRSEGAELTERLGMLYLELAEIWLRKDQPQEALLCLERVARSCPGTHYAAVAQERLRRIREEHPQEAKRP